MADFRCVTDTISEIKESLNEVHNALAETLQQAKHIQATLADPNVWQGESQLVGSAFLDLVVLYHGLLSTEDGYSGPILEAMDTLQEYLDHDGAFYEEWKEYQELSDV